MGDFTHPTRDRIAITPNQTASVIAHVKQVVKHGDLRLHPIVTKLVDTMTLDKMGASKIDQGDAK